MLTKGTLRAALVAGALIMIAVLPRVAARVSPGEPAIHEIRLVVRDMAYHSANDAEVNPTLRVRAGERVRIILTNTETGMSHDFVIPDWKVSTPVLKGKGSEAVEFTAPATIGTHDYNCTPHAATMRGTIAVE